MRASRLASHARKAQFINTVLNILLVATGWQRSNLTSCVFTTGLLIIYCADDERTVSSKAEWRLFWSVVNPGVPLA